MFSVTSMSIELQRTKAGLPYLYYVRIFLFDTSYLFGDRYTMLSDRMTVFSQMIYQRPELYSFHCRFCRLWNHFKFCNQRSWLIYPVVLEHWYKIIIFSVKKLSQIFCRAEERVVGRYGKQYRFSAAQMRLYSHCYRSVCGLITETFWRYVPAQI